MNAIRITAEVEGDTLTIPNMGQFKGHQVELFIVPFDDEREEFIKASLARLSRSYGEDEPEYSEQDVLERNPGYEKR